MKRVCGSSVLLVLGITVCALMFLCGCGDQEEVFSGSDNKGNKQIEFVVPIKLDQYVAMVEKFSIETDEINFQIGEFSGGYTLKSGDVGKELLLARKVFVQNMKDILNIEKEGASKNFSELRQNMYTAIKTDSQDQILFSGAVVRGSTEAIMGMTREGIIVNPSDVKTQQHESAMAPQSSSHEAWAPCQGITHVARNFTYNTFVFNSVPALNSNSTYEHETHLLSGYATYGGSWSSNLPRAYKDTQVGDSNDINNFTVGCARSTDIQTDKSYYTWMTLTPGDKTTSIIRIKGQLGKRIIPWIYSTWNIFAVATTYPDCMYTGTAPMVDRASWNY